MVLDHVCPYAFLYFDNLETAFATDFFQYCKFTYCIYPYCNVCTSCLDILYCTSTVSVLIYTVYIRTSMYPYSTYFAFAIKIILFGRCVSSGEIISSLGYAATRKCFFTTLFWCCDTYAAQRST